MIRTREKPDEFSSSSMVDPIFFGCSSPVLPTINGEPGLKLVDSSAASLLSQALTRTGLKRPRGEKKPIPDDQKDDRYFERRKRNNLAAKKSRDQRKKREDALASRATFLERENAIWRTHVVALQEERNSLQGLILRRQLQQKQKVLLTLVVEQQQKQIQFMEMLKMQKQNAQTEEGIVDLSGKGINNNDSKEET